MPVLRSTGFQKDICTNESAPTAQLQSLSVSLEIIAYRKWGFRVMGVSRAFLKIGTCGAAKFARRLLYFRVGPGARWGLLKPLYGLSGACKERYETLGSFMTNLGSGAVAVGGLTRYVSVLLVGGSCDYGCGDGISDKCIGVAKYEFPRRINISERKQKEML